MVTSAQRIDRVRGRLSKREQPRRAGSRKSRSAMVSRRLNRVLGNTVDSKLEAEISRLR